MPKTQLPDIFPKWTKLEIVSEIISLLALTLTAGLSVHFLKGTAVSIPTHFTLMGVPDSYGSKEMIFFYLLPCLIIYALIFILEAHPNYFKYPVEITEENAEKFYKISRFFLSILKLEITLFFAYFVTAIELIVAKKMTSIFWGFKIISICIMAATVLVFCLVMLHQKSKEKTREE